MRMLVFFALLVGAARGFGQVPRSVDLSGVKPGPIIVARTADPLVVDWKDKPAKQWEARFSLNSSSPLITSISVDGRVMVDRADPIYRCVIGRRKGGWDNFFDDPTDGPEGAPRGRSYTCYGSAPTVFSK